MTYNTPETIAKLFRDSVICRNFRSITSYEQLLSPDDAFYTLTNRDAFSALLRDYLYEDTQLLTIFLDLFDAKLGIQKFARANARLSPQSTVSFFLSEAKYAHHEAAISKVYVAINTWLVFFDLDKIAVEWEKCPFCRSALKSGICTAKDCGKSTRDFRTAYADLHAQLMTEKSGKQTTNPACWNKIKPDSEFDIAFKREIIHLREERQNKELALKEEAKQHQQELVQQAIEQVHKYKLLLDLEDGKKEKNYDAILDQIKKDPLFFEASKTGNLTLKKQVDNLIKAINQKRIDISRQKELEEKQEVYNTKLHTLIALQLRLRNDLEESDPSYPEYEALVKEAEGLASQIEIEIKLGRVTVEKNDSAVVNHFLKVLLPILKKFLKDWNREIEKYSKSVKEIQKRRSSLSTGFESGFEHYANVLYDMAMEGRLNPDEASQHRQSLLSFFESYKQSETELSELTRQHEEKIAELKDRTIGQLLTE